ncbi:MAG: hypothetical protein P794_05275 [Epsilonproteobacteria bacterium (ex Lamellibrachia satsuma)]|nr:MAG: hypothetical protein P794_05275 [Epsilonproteobacteria bacterium (ex Lamellibrachia satsuma)]
MNGSYTLTVSTDDLTEGATLLVQGGYDRVTKMPFIGTMTAMIDEANLTAQQMITPLTTLVHERAEAAQEDMQTAQEDVAALLGLTVDELQANMLELQDQGALQAAMAMQQAAELASDANDTRGFYRAMAENMSAQYNDNLDGLMQAVADQNPSEVEQLRVKYFAEAMDAMGTVADPELYAMSVERMQEMIADMNISSSMTGQLDTGFALVSNFVNSMMVTSPDDVEVYVTEHLLEAAGIAQPIIDQVAQTIVNNAEITVDTEFGMMEAIIVENEDLIKTQLEAAPLSMNPDQAQAEYDAMIAQLETMKAAFEQPAS